MGRVVGACGARSKVLTPLRAVLYSVYFRKWADHYKVDYPTPDLPEDV